MGSTSSAPRMPSIEPLHALLRDATYRVLDLEPGQPSVYDRISVWIDQTLQQTPGIEVLVIQEGPSRSFFRAYTAMFLDEAMSVPNDAQAELQLLNGSQLIYTTRSRAQERKTHRVLIHIAGENEPASLVVFGQVWITV